MKAVRLGFGPGSELHLGRYELTRHFQLETWVLSLGRSETRAELLCRARSPFGEGRAPLYLCPCGDLDCSALTVQVGRGPRGFVWSRFGWQCPGSTPTQDARLERFGPFLIDEEAYQYAVASGSYSGPPILS